MTITRATGPQDFLHQTLEVRSLDPFRTNLIGSVATSIMGTERDTDACFWWLVENNQGKIVSLMMRTHVHPLVLTPMSSDLLSEAVDAVIAADPNLPGVSGPKELVEEFLRLFIQRHPNARPIKSTRGELLYALSTLKEPQYEGELITATSAHYERALEWMMAFGVEAELIMDGVKESVAKKIENSELYFWQHEGQIVSVVGHAAIVSGPTGKVARIGPVYTPPEFRGRGYASFCTAAVSQILLKLPAQLMLYTDAANPTSNGIYTKLGYELIDENISVLFL